MVNTVVMTSEQTRHLQEVADTWLAYGSIVQSKRQLVGGLQWKKVAGNEYLYRYQPDPITKQKRSTSVGRRTPETEALYDAFVTGRDQLAARSAAVEPILETQARVSKALRLNRFSDDGARVVIALWEDKLFEHVLALGNNAISAYEVEYARLVESSAPAARRSQPFFDSDRNNLAFLVPDDEEFVEEMLASMRRIDRTYQVIGTTITGERGPRIWIYGREQIYTRVFEMGDPSDVETVELLFDLPIVSTVAISKSGFPVPINAVNPVAYAAFASMVRDDPALASTFTSLALDRDTEGYDLREYLAATYGKESPYPSSPRSRM